MAIEKPSAVGPVVAGLFILLIGFLVFTAAFGPGLGVFVAPLAGFGTGALLYWLRLRRSRADHSNSKLSGR